MRAEFAFSASPAGLVPDRLRADPRQPGPEAVPPSRKTDDSEPGEIVYRIEAAPVPFPRVFPQL